MARWMAAYVALVLVPIMLLAGPLPSQDVATVAAMAVVGVLVLASVVALFAYRRAFGVLQGAAPAGPDHEDRHRGGAFRRQQAPGTPGRPGRPRAPGSGPVGLVR